MHPTKRGGAVLKTRRQLSRDGKAMWCYVAGVFSLLVYSCGAIYACWAALAHEWGTGFLYTTDGTSEVRLLSDISPSLWRASWAFDVCFYIAGMAAALAMMLGVWLLRPNYMIVWIVHGCILAAKNISQLVAVLAYARHTAPVVVASVQLATALVQIMLVYVVISKFDQLSNLHRLGASKQQLISASQQHYWPTHTYPAIAPHHFLAPAPVTYGAPLALPPPPPGYA